MLGDINNFWRLINKQVKKERIHRDELINF